MKENENNVDREENESYLDYLKKYPCVLKWLKDFEGTMELYEKLEMLEITEHERRILQQILKDKCPYVEWEDVPPPFNSYHKKMWGFNCNDGKLKVQKKILIVDGQTNEAGIVWEDDEETQENNSKTDILRPP